MAAFRTGQCLRPGEYPRLEHHACLCLYEDRWGDPEPLRQCSDLTGIDLALAAQHLADIGLSAEDLREIGLPQVVMIHQESQYLGGGRIGDLDSPLLVVTHEECHNIKKAHERVILTIPDLSSLFMKSKHVPSIARNHAESGSLACGPEFAQRPSRDQMHLPPPQFISLSL